MRPGATAMETDMLKPMRQYLVAWLMLVTCAAPACAWSSKEHVLLTRLAAMGLLADPRTPEPMKQWLRDALGEQRTIEQEKELFLHGRVGIVPRGVDGLAYWSVMPDLIADLERDRKLEPYGVNEGRLHYIDVEFFAPDPQKRRYVDDLSGKPTLADFPRDMTDERYASAGMLPFAVERTYAQLVAAIRAGRLNDRPGQFPRDEHATRYAGWLAHYLQDNTQPHHATIDFRSHSYFPDTIRAPNVHGDMEFRLVDDDKNDYPQLRAQLWDELMAALERVEDPVRSDDLWQATIEVALISYDALPMIGRAARLAYPRASAAGPGPWDADAFFNYRGRYLGREMTVLQMKAHQLAWAVKRVQRVWRQAWAQGTR
jgi:hypothetical protein